MHRLLQQQLLATALGSHLLLLLLLRGCTDALSCSQQVLLLRVAAVGTCGGYRVLLLVW